ncbi:MAG: hypothetical protein ABIL25_07645 [candidate division WOR-3 bacterium]
MSTPRPISAVVRLPEFERDFARLLRKYRTLEDDLVFFTEYALRLFHEKGLPTGRIERVAGLGFDEPPVYVAKKFACQALKSKGSCTGIRVVWAWFPDEGRIEFAEIYLKADKAVEDKQRLKKRYGRSG